MGWATATQTAKLTASDGAVGDCFGCSVGIGNDGSAIVAGALFSIGATHLSGRGLRLWVFGYHRASHHSLHYQHCRQQ